VPALSVTPSEALEVDGSEVPVPVTVSDAVPVPVADSDALPSPPSPHAPTNKHALAPRIKPRIDIPTSRMKGAPYHGPPPSDRRRADEAAFTVAA
jgi:hypothetical protein